MKPIYITIFLFFGILINYTQAQNVVANSGGHFESPQLQISWTLGEPIIETIGAGDYILTQGFHQSILTVTAIENIPELQVEIKAYPNPVTTKVNLSVNSDNFQDWTYSLYNAEGKLLVSKNINTGITEIPMQMYVASNYILQVKQNNRELKSFKIVKSR
ncbi:MAG: T9SS type A sorting domain-containing protein [Prolixibacteraceae bacterium]|nr:T9SS type A sorting domain-containing protein [Prolixibacteraceae bacterium]